MTQPTPRQTIDGLLALKEMSEFFRSVHPQIKAIVDLMEQAQTGEGATCLVRFTEAIDLIDKASADDKDAMLVVATGMLAKIRVAFRGTEVEQQIKDIFA